jgi:hypothetical protein
MEYLNKSTDLGSKQIQGVLASTLSTEKYHSDVSTNTVVFQQLGSSYDAFIDNEDSSDDEVDTSSNTVERKEVNIYSFGKDPVNQFFIGSVTVVGLFLLYRFLQKSK